MPDLSRNVKKVIEDRLIRVNFNHNGEDILNNSGQFSKFGIIELGLSV